MKECDFCDQPATTEVPCDGEGYDVCATCAAILREPERDPLCPDCDEVHG
jgi:hypothetical protein